MVSISAPGDASVRTPGSGIPEIPSKQSFDCIAFFIMADTLSQLYLFIERELPGAFPLSFPAVQYTDWEQETVVRTLMGFG